MTDSVRSAKSTTRQAAKKAAARPGPRADKADGESAVLTKIAGMPEPERAHQGEEADLESASSTR